MRCYSIERVLGPLITTHTAHPSIVDLSVQGTRSTIAPPTTVIGGLAEGQRGRAGGGSTWGARSATVRAVLGAHEGAREPSGVFARHQGDASAPGASSPLCTPAAPPHIPVAGRR